MQPQDKHFPPQQGSPKAAWGCLVPGALVMIVSWAWATAAGAEGIWGDALPYVMVFWLGFLLLLAGGVAAFVIRRQATLPVDDLSHPRDGVDSK